VAKRGKYIVAKPKILIADDHDAIRKILIRCLSSEFEILGAVSNGMELVGSAISLNPEVIVSDISMPLMTGPEAMRQLNAAGLKIPFVFISAGENVVGQDALFVSKHKLMNELTPAFILCIKAIDDYFSQNGCS
jgi:CheY-like chemotaxis protein